jgi:RimJ/RimL family protein N-acetyltransferase
MSTGKEIIVPELLTPRLKMRGMAEEDVDELWATVGRADVMEHYVDLADHSSGWSKQRTEQFINGCLAAWSKDGFGRWGLERKDTNALIGYCGLNAVDYLPEIEPAVEISFRLHPDHWGQGLGPEASIATLDWAFRNLEAGSIVGCTVPENIQSIRALGKLGMTHELTLPYHSPISGRDTEFQVHRISSDEWAARR